MKKEIEILPVSTGRDIDAIFANFAQKPVDALVVGPSPFFNNRRVQIVTLAAYPKCLRSMPSAIQLKRAV